MVEKGFKPTSLTPNLAFFPLTYAACLDMFFPLNTLCHEC